jgi:hypothetical protein
MDERCRVQATGGLDGLFKVKRRTWRFAPSSHRGVSVSPKAPWSALRGKTMPLYPVETTLSAQGGEVLATAGDVPCLIRTTHGKGRCYYLNWDLGRYITLREAKSPDQATLKAVFAQLLEDAGVTPRVRFEQLSGQKGNFEFFQWQRGPAYLVSLQRAADFQESAVGGMAKKADGGEAADRLEVSLPAKGHVYDIISGTYLGQGPKVRVDVPVAAATVLVVTPYKPRALELTVKKDGQCTIALKTDAARTCSHVVHVDAVRAGKVDPNFSHNVTLNASGTWQGKLPLDRIAAGGEYTIRIRDVVSGLTAEGEPQ